MADPRPQATSEKDATPLQHIDKAPDPELVDKTAQSDETTIRPDSPPTHQEAGQPKPVPIASDPASFPDGGTKAWLSVLGCFCSMTVTLGWIQSVGKSQQANICTCSFSDCSSPSGRPQGYSRRITNSTSWPATRTTKSPGSCHWKPSASLPAGSWSARWATRTVRASCFGAAPW